MNWKPMSGAPNEGQVLARDVDGMERQTWNEGGVWLYEGWRENADQEEYQTVEFWEPTEYTYSNRLEGKEPSMSDAPWMSEWD